MKKEASYFNFGLIITVLAIGIQFFLMLILQLFTNPPETLGLIIPPVLAVVISFVWYRREKAYLKWEQYCIAIIPVVLFLITSLVVVLKDFFQVQLFNVFLISFFAFYIALRLLIDSLITKFRDEKIAHLLAFKSFIYLLWYSLLMWGTASLMFSF